MNRTDRLLALILELQSRSVCRAEDLAATFEISKRTVYRDMEALAEAGVPVISTPGQGYALVKGYFLPPVRFTTDEAITLLLGTTLMNQTFDLDYQRASTTAAHKITALLSEAERERVTELQKQIQFIAPPGEQPIDMQATIARVRRALLESRLVRFLYHPRQTAPHTEAEPEIRDVEPYHLAHVGGNWQLIGYCRLRQDIRVFRLSRMENIQVLSQRFDPAIHRAQFEQIQQRLAQPNYPFTAHVQFDSDVARWIMEDRLFYIVARKIEPSGVISVTLNAPDAQAVLQWILSWGQHVTMIAPESLRQLVIEEWRAALDKLSHPDSVMQTGPV